MKRMKTSKTAKPKAAPAPKVQRGIQSVEVGGKLLQTLAHLGKPLPLKELALEAGMSPAKAHPYLVSFVKLGLVAQSESSGHYGLGPLALQLGLMSLQQVDPLQLASGRLSALAQQFGLTMALAVWGHHGPTIVRIEAAPMPVHVSMRHGTVMSLQGTASGQLFAAYLPQEVVQEVWARESAYKNPARKTAWPAGWADKLERIRTEGVAVSQDVVVAGISAIAVPIFEAPLRIVLALIALGPSALMDLRRSSPLTQCLVDEAATISRQVGGLG
jgi:DNA-binding IclR family transcriptional regulator